MNKIANIFCVGRNYLEHARELNNAVPKQPMFFMKPTHAAVFLEQNDQVSLPFDQGAVHYEVELVVRMKRTYEKKRPLADLIAEVALGIDFTLRDAQQKAKESGKPWLSAKGFKNSAVLSHSIPFESESWFNTLTFSLERNGELVQTGKPDQMIFSLREILRSCDQQFGLVENDWIFTGTPAGVGEVNSGDTFRMQVAEVLSQSFEIA